ncbi:MAG: glycosyltransferase family 4 protein [Microcoleaceae cyanobacterium]
MKILHLNSTDIEGGAARAAYRLHCGLRSAGVNSKILVRAKSSIDKTVIADKTILTKLGPPSLSIPLKLYPQRQLGMFSSQWLPDTIATKVKQFDSDIIHLHWICSGFLQVETLAKFKKPLVWTLHDMWPFTGGCHYADECLNYTDVCGTCPQLNSHKGGDLSHWVWQRKHKAWKDLNLTIVSPSHWLADCARSSSLFKNTRIEVIPHGLDLEKYKPVQQQVARELLNLPQDKHLVLFGASPGTTSSPRKGFQYLKPALQSLSQSDWKDKFELVIFGDIQPETPIDLGFKTYYLGQFYDDISLALVYSAANVMVVPSTQEAFGQTASEAMACGTPVVAFECTGLKDIVQHQQNGYLAKPFNIDDLAQGIAWILKESDRYDKLRFNARSHLEQEFNLKLQAQRYLSIYQEIYQEVL